MLMRVYLAAEERQDRNEKRRRTEEHDRQDRQRAAKNGGLSLNGTDYVQVPASNAKGGRIHPSLPSRPGFDVKPIEEVVPPKQGESGAIWTSSCADSHGPRCQEA